MNKTTRNILIKTSMLTFFTAFVILITTAKIRRERGTVEDIHITLDAIQGNYFFTREYILDYLKERYPVSGKQMLAEDLKNVESEIRNIPQVKDAEAFFDNKNELNIHITQRKPIARVFTLSGQTFYLDEQGYKIPVSLQYTAKVPLVTGNVTEPFTERDTIQSASLKRVFSMLTMANSDDFVHVELGQYDIENNGDIVAIPKLADFEIILATEDMKEQFKKLRVFYKEGLTYIGWDSIQSVNLKYGNQVVVKKLHNINTNIKI